MLISGTPATWAMRARAQQPALPEARELLNELIPLSAAIAILVDPNSPGLDQDLRGQTFLLESQRHIDQIDCGVLRMSSGGHHADQPASNVPGDEELIALLRDAEPVK